MYPFPFWGRAIWSMVKMFLDPRTARKVILLPGNWSSVNSTAPRELFDYVEAEQVQYI